MKTPDLSLSPQGKAETTRNTPTKMSETITYKAIVTEVTIEKDPKDPHTSPTRVKVIDEGGGPYFEVTQNNDIVTLDPEEIELLAKVAKMVLPDFGIFPQNEGEWVSVPKQELEWLSSCSDGEMYDGDTARDLSAEWLQGRSGRDIIERRSHTPTDLPWNRNKTDR